MHAESADEFRLISDSAIAQVKVWFQLIADRSLSPNGKNDCPFWLMFSRSPSLGLTERQDIKCDESLSVHPFKPLYISFCRLLSSSLTMCHIVESYPLTKLNGGLSRLHSADEDAVSWLTSYGL